MTGVLVEKVEITSEEMSCARDSKDILLAAGQSNFANADKMCNKLMQGSLGPYFPDMPSYRKLYAKINDLERFKDRCWNGGRVRLYVPYRKAAGEKEWKHLKDSSAIGVNTTSRNTGLGTEPEDKDKCFVWYSGPVSASFGHFLSYD